MGTSLIYTESSSTGRCIHRNLVLKRWNEERKKCVVCVQSEENVCLQNTNGTSMSYALPLRLRSHREEGTSYLGFTVVSFPPLAERFIVILYVVIFNVYFYYQFMVHTYMSTMSCKAGESQRDIWAPRTGFEDICEPQCQCWELNPVPLEEHPVILATTPSIQFIKYYFLRKKNNV